MIYIYGLSRPLLVTLAAMLVIATALQTVRLLILMTHLKNKVDIIKVIFECFIVYYYVITILTISVTLLQKGVFANYFQVYRYLYFIPVLISPILLFKNGNNLYLLSSLLFTLNTPVLDFNFSTLLFPLTGLAFVLRTTILLEKEWLILRNNITRISIVEAVDSYPGGIIYANSNGKTLIINPSMNRLLDEMRISLRSDALKLWELTKNLQDSYDFTVRSLEDKLLIRIRNAGSWLFSMDRIHTKRRDYIQLLAVDITDEDILTREMEETNQTLEELSSKLINAVNNIETIQQESEVLKMKTRVHDILAQRLSILSKILDSDEEPELVVSKLEPLLNDLSGAIAEPIDTSPDYLLDSMISSFTLIGTRIHLKDPLPNNTEVAKLFTEVIRESSTNAIRHGNANNIFASISEDDCNYSLLISNDGEIPELPISEGGGITGMRSKIQDLGGELALDVVSSFTVRVRIPKYKDGDRI